MFFREKTKTRPVIVIGLMLAILCAASSCSGVKWDGCFPRAEYRVAFKGADGKPVAKVVLRVEQTDGEPSYDYPVDDFRKDNAPTSGEDGVITFHHVGGGLEFGGFCWMLFGFIPLNDMSGPDIKLRFIKDYRTIALICYKDLPHEGKNISIEEWERWPRVSRTVKEIYGKDSDKIKLPGDAKQIDFPIFEKEIKTK